MDIKKLIEDAAIAAGSQRKLAALLELDPSNLVEMKSGKRPANWRVRGGLRAILGEDPARAFMAAMAEDLESSELPDEKKAAEGFQAMLSAFPDEEKPLNANTQGFDSWRKRMFSTLDIALATVFLRLGNTVHSALSYRLGNTVFQRQTLIGM